MIFTVRPGCCATCAAKASTNASNGASAKPAQVVRPGDTVAVLGLGPIGAMACRILQQQGVEDVIGIDLVDERLAREASETKS